MEERFKPSIREETKTEIMRSLPRKEALDEKEQGTFLLIKMLRILDNCKAWPISRPRTRRKPRQQQKHTNQILGLILGEKNNRKLTLRHNRRKEC
jgi:hypothetical protein